MTDDGSKLRDTMGRHLDGLQPGTPIEQIRHRARRGRVLMATSLVALIAVVGASGVFMLDRFANDEVDRVVGPAPTDVSGQIVFSRFSNDGGIMTMNGDGTDVRKVADGAGYALDEPAWSPDGKKIAFHGFSGEARTEAGGLFVMDADGSNVELIEEAGDAPTWSPDGERIAFYSGEDGSLRVKDLGQTTSETIVEQEGYRIDTPDWSPDGRRVVFGGVELDILHLEDGSREVFLRVRGGSGQLLLDPAWSPDGTQIAYTEVTDTSDGSVDLATVKVIEVETFQTRTLGEGADPAWSPDGQRIAFERTDGDRSHIYTIDVDGTDLHQLTSGPDSDHSPDWTATFAEEASPQDDSTVHTNDESGLTAACEHSSLRPDYLPWVRSTDPIPRPQEDFIPSEQMEGQEPTASAAILAWSLTRTEHDYYRVTLISTTGTHQVSDTTSPVSVNGRPGYVHPKPGAEKVSIVWDLGTASCNLLVLAFDAPSLSAHQREEEILRIARSLS